MFTSVLSVSGVTPNRGSLNGGAVLTIAGQGFGTNITDNMVMLGDVPCDVIESTESEMKCRTPSGGRIAEVDNSGSHPGQSRERIQITMKPRALSINTARPVRTVKLLNGTQNIWASDLSVRKI